MNLSYFETLAEADGYIIDTAPWVGYIRESSQTLYCKEIDYRIVVDNNLVDIEKICVLRYNSASKLTAAQNLGTVMTHTYDSNTGKGIVIYYNDITSIGVTVFRNCTDLISITIPNSVTSIGTQAFYGCTNLTSISIPNSVTSIGEFAFSGCSGLTSVTIPNSVTSIGYCAFRDCSGLPVENNLRYADTYLVEAVDKTLSSYIIKEGTRWIGTSAFSACTNLTSIEIPNSVTRIGLYAFYNCSGLTTVTIPNSVTSIGKSAFYGCSDLTSVIIPENVTSIESKAFYNCSSLTEVTINSLNIASGNKVDRFGGLVTHYIIGGNVVSISSFGDCKNLTLITIVGNNVTSIQNLAFNGCSLLSSINIPNSVTYIGLSAFAECTSLPVENGLRYADTCLVEATDKSLLTYTIKNVTRFIGSYAFQDCVNLASITIPDSVTNIGGYAFQNCSNLTSINISNNIKSISSLAFINCTSLTKVNISDIAAWCNITFNDDNSNPLYYAKHLYINNVEVTNLVIPDSITSINARTFTRCVSFTSVTIPNSVTSIGNRAFYNCTDLTEITCKNPTPPTIQSNTWSNVPKTIPLYVPSGYESDYASAQYWGDFTNIQAIPQS